MKVKGSVRPVWARWSDPGDYPSGAGSGPLRARWYIEDVQGWVTVELEPGEPLPTLDDLCDAADEHADVRVLDWRVEIVCSPARWEPYDD